jgi:hypothetical protein
MAVPGVGVRRLGWLRPLAVQLPIRNTENAFSRIVTLETQLDREQLEAIEELRRGRDFNLSIVYWFSLNDAGSVVQHLQAQEVIEINRGVWIALLEQMGYTKLALLEVPVFDDRISPDLAQASEHLHKAQDAMLRGEYREAVGCCRDVLESIGRALRDTDEPSKPVRELTKAERLQRVRNALKVFTHPARHADEVAATFDWTRLDAATTIAMCAALVQELGAPGARPQLN